MQRVNRWCWTGSGWGSVWEQETSLLSVTAGLEGIGRVGSVWSGCTYSEVHSGKVNTASSLSMGNSALKIVSTVTVTKEGLRKTVRHPSLEVIKIQVGMTLRTLL